MRILLTNDDGIESTGLLLLADNLRRTGHRVLVLAPAADQSGVSHSITFLNSPCKLAEISRDTWACEGTPVDCIVIALFGGLKETSLKDSPPELIISGINRGANLGTDIVYSGTAAAARQGALCNIPSMAVSLVEGAEWNWDMAANFAAERLDEIRSWWKPGSFINVNIPNRKEKPHELIRAFPSIRYYNDSIDVYRAPDGHRYCFARAGKISARPEQGSDWEVLEGNNASLSEVFIHPLLLESVKERGVTPQGGVQ